MLDKVHSSYYPIMKNLHKDRLFDLIYNNDVSPTPDKIFNVFSMPLGEIKVVLLGQDPYPTRNMATGYAFEPGIDKIPASLRIMQQELGQDINFPKLREQGFFLLNTALTTEVGNAGSHIDKWRKFSENLIKFISANTEVIWILLGKHAQSYIPFIKNVVHVDEYHKIEDLPIYTNNIILTAPHPAAEVYSGGKSGFIGSEIFKKTDEIYKLKYGKNIEWN